MVPSASITGCRLTWCALALIIAFVPLAVLSAARAVSLAAEPSSPFGPIVIAGAVISAAGVRASALVSAQGLVAGCGQ